MIPAPVMRVLATMALVCSLSLAPVKPWEPEPEFLYFTGNGRINIFRTGYNSGDVWAEE